MGKWGGDEMSVVGGLQSLGQISRGAAKAIGAARSRSSTQQLDPGHSERFSPFLLQSLSDPPFVPLLFVFRRAYSVVHVRTYRVISARLPDETHASTGVEAPPTVILSGLS